MENVARETHIDECRLLPGHEHRVATASHAEPMCGDVNDSETVTSVDALLVLRQSVGQPVALECPDFLSEALPASFGPAMTEPGHTFDFWRRVIQ